MLKHLSLFLLFTTLCINGASATGTCTETTNNCEFGEWCEKQESTEGIAYVCSMCTNKPDSAEYTGRGTNAANCPWKMTCTNKPEFENGTWGPDSETITYTGTGEAPQCTYTNPAKVTCDTSGGVCDMGYYFNGHICTEVASISNSGSTLTIHTPAPVQRYVSACTDENWVLDEKYNCNNEQYGTCVPQSISCSQSVNTTACSDGELPNGDTANWDKNLHAYNFKTCRCIYEQDIEGTDETIIGKKQEICFYDEHGQTATDCDNWEIVGCIPGYCGVDTRNGTPSTNGNDATCMLAPKGYYNGAPISDGKTSTSCNECPAGATTTAEGAKSKQECKYTGDTVFQDMAGTFTLPITGTVTSIDWSWY